MALFVLCLIEKVYVLGQQPFIGLQKLIRKYICCLARWRAICSTKSVEKIHSEPKKQFISIANIHRLAHDELMRVELKVLKKILSKLKKQFIGIAKYTQARSRCLGERHWHALCSKY